MRQGDTRSHKNTHVSGDVNIMWCGHHAGNKTGGDITSVVSVHGNQGRVIMLGLCVGSKVQIYFGTMTLQAPNRKDTEKKQP